MSEQISTNRIRLSTDQQDFLKKEAEKLNSEVEKLLQETRSREKYSLAIISAIATWIFTHLENADINLLRIIGCIPIITTIIYGFSVKYLYQNMQWIGAYLKKIENYFLENTLDNDGNPWGWEKYFDSENKKKKFVRVTQGIWILQLLFALSVFIIVLFK